MAEPTSTVALTAFLFAQYVGEGMGFPSTPKAAYVCGYDQAVYHLDKAGLVSVELTPGTPARFRIRHLEIVGDDADDYQQVRVAQRGLAFSALNRTKQSIYFTVIVEDTETGAVIECDPQMTNTPVV